MIEGRASRTALRVAMHRAAHQLLDRPKVFDDPLALEIIGPELLLEVRRECCVRSLPRAAVTRKIA